MPFLLRRTFSVQRGRMALHRHQDVVGLRGDDVVSDLGLTAQRVDRHQTAGKFQDLQQLRDRGDRVAFVIDHHWAPRDPIGRGPRADHVNRGLAAGRSEAARSLNDRVRGLHPCSSLGGTDLLTVDRHDLTIADFVQSGDPTQQTLLELGGIDRREEGVEPIVRRKASTQIQKLRQPLLPGASPHGDGQAAMATKSSAPHTTAHTAIVTTLSSG